MWLGLVTNFTSKWCFLTFVYSFTRNKKYPKQIQDDGLTLHIFVSLHSLALNDVSCKKRLHVL